MMDFLEVVMTRRSCRQYKEDLINDSDLNTILECANWAPCPLNLQPWEFIVIKNKQLKKQIFESSCQSTNKLAEVSGKRWLSHYKVDFLIQAPVIIAVVGDPNKSGLDGKESYQHACAAAIENMLLASNALGLDSLWFTLFDQQEISKIIGVSTPKRTIALICIGYGNDSSPRPHKKDLASKVTTLV